MGLLFGSAQGFGKVWAPELVRGLVWDDMSCQGPDVLLPMPSLGTLLL